MTRNAKGQQEERAMEAMLKRTRKTLTAEQRDKAARLAATLNPTCQRCGCANVPGGHAAGCQDGQARWGNVPAPGHECDDWRDGYCSRCEREKETDR